MNVDQRSMWEYIVQLYAHKSLSSSQLREISLSVGVMNRSATVTRTSFTITQAAAPSTRVEWAS